MWRWMITMKMDMRLRTLQHGMRRVRCVTSRDVIDNGLRADVAVDESVVSGTHRGEVFQHGPWGRLSLIESASWLIGYTRHCCNICEVRMHLGVCNDSSVIAILANHITTFETSVSNVIYGVSLLIHEDILLSLHFHFIYSQFILQSIHTITI